jgi:UPF0755 protein
LLAALGGTLLVLCAVVAGWSYWTITAPYLRGDQARWVWVNPGTSVSRIAEDLQSAGVIRSARAFVWYARGQASSSSLKAGEYHFTHPISTLEVFEKLRKGEVYRVRVTVPEGLSRQEIVMLLSSNGFGPPDRLRQATAARDLIRSLDTAAEDLEGYLFPDTYFFARRATPKEIARTMVSGFTRVWTEGRQERARELGLSVREVVTLASLIEEETGASSERPLVSAVFHNRLRRNIPLACDPTVVYGVKRAKPYDGVINRSDLELDSPYNTYLRAGLPPGPICNPGSASIDAALYPASVDYLYFVSKNDGTHVFSSDYASHQSAVRRYQRRRMKDEG